MAHSNNNRNNNRINIINKNTNKTEREILAEIDDIRKKETTLLHKLSYEKKKEQIEKKKVFYEVAHFSFNDFARIVIGCCVFSLAALIDTDVWNALPSISMKTLFLVHLFFSLCVIVSLNYEYRDNLKIDLWFMKMLLKQFFYTYFSVFMIMSLIMILVNRMTYDLTLFEVTKNFLAAQSIGMFGAIAFSFLKRS